MLGRGVQPQIARPPLHDSEPTCDRLWVACLHHGPDGVPEGIKAFKLQLEHVICRFFDELLDSGLDGFIGGRMIGVVEFLGDLRERLAHLPQFESGQLPVERTEFVRGDRRLMWVRHD